MSSIMQHVGSAHPEIRLPRAVLYGLVERGEKIGHARPGALLIAERKHAGHTLRLRAVWFFLGSAFGSGLLLLMSHLAK